MVSPRQMSKRFQIYYDDFKQGIKYCVRIKMKQLSVVRNVEQTGVMVYYYEEKGLFFNITKLISVCLNENLIC